MNIPKCHQMISNVHCWDDLGAIASMHHSNIYGVVNSHLFVYKSLAFVSSPPWHVSWDSMSIWRIVSLKQPIWHLTWLLFRQSISHFISHIFQIHSNSICHFILHCIYLWRFIWNSSGILSARYSDMLSRITSGILFVSPGILSGIRFGSAAPQKAGELVKVIARLEEQDKSGVVIAIKKEKT